MTYDHLVKCYFHCRKGKAYRLATVLYHMNYPLKLLHLLNELKNGTYEIKDLYSFVIYEPKKRNITANQFEDKIVQRLICEYVLRPVIAPKLIYDNYASQPGKGTHLALHRLQKFMISYAKSVDWTNRGWVLVCDIKKFFYTIDRTVCYNLVDELPIDEKLKGLIHDQIFACGPEYNEYTDDPNRGLCIGFQTSQWLAVYYMNGLDHLIKEELHIKYYGRYMDDFYIIHEDRDYLTYCYQRINEYVTKVLNLTLNKKTHIHPFSQGVCFLGYHCIYNTDTHNVDTAIRSGSINRMLKRVNNHKKLIQLGKITTKNANEALMSWHSYATHGNTNKAKNAYQKALSILYPFDYEWSLMEYQIEMHPELVDPDGFILLHHTDEYRDVDGFQRLILHVENKREYDKRMKMTKIIDPPRLHAWKKHKKRVIDTEDKLRESALNMIAPASNKKKKKSKKKDPWKELDQYRDEEGFVVLQRRGSQ